MISPIKHLIESDKKNDSQNITVVCRVRPINHRESTIGANISTLKTKCVSVQEGNKSIIINTKPEAKNYTFDYVADENTSQEKMFQVVGLPVTNTCLEGYNSTIICYGQTGSGKSYTTFGVANSTNGDTTRGLVPRVLEYIFQHISKVQSDIYSQQNNLSVTYTCGCSFYEIYQEKVFDLLDPISVGQNINTPQNSLQVREDTRLGVYVVGLIEESVSSSDDATRVLALGYNNRHVGETNMNRESSRSHAVFLLNIKSVEVNNDTGVKRHCMSKFSLVDLAGRYVCVCVSICGCFYMCIFVCAGVGVCI